MLRIVKGQSNEKVNPKKTSVLTLFPCFLCAVRVGKRWTAFRRTVIESFLEGVYHCSKNGKKYMCVSIAQWRSSAVDKEAG